jgi:hypothetical protein
MSATDTVRMSGNRYGQNEWEQIRSEWVGKLCRSVQLAEVADATTPSRKGKDVPAARKGRLRTSGMSAGAAATATNKEKEEKRANQQGQLSAMKQKLPSVTARLQEL